MRDAKTAQPLVWVGAPVPQIPCWHGPHQSPPQMPEVRPQAIPQQPKHQFSFLPLWGSPYTKSQLTPGSLWRRRRFNQDSAMTGNTAAYLTFPRK